MDYNSDTSNEALDKLKGGITGALKNTLRNPGKKLSRAAKVIKKIIQLLIKAIKALIAALGIWFFVILAAILLFGWVYNLVYTQRGSSFDMIFSDIYENPGEIDDEGIFHAKALVEPQAFADAYYKYMSVNSYKKFYYDDPKEVFIQFDKEDQTEDFAGLADYYKRENYFYLSSYFIKMVDENFHDNKFSFPEQIIQSVYYEIEDGKVVAKKLIEGEENEDRTLVAESKIWDEEGLSQLEETTPGVWDYGFGSVLQYGPFTKDEFIMCEYNSVGIDVHVFYWKKHSKTIEHKDRTTEKRIWYTKEFSSCCGDIMIPISAGDTAGSIQSKIDVYDETPPPQSDGASWKEVVAQPSSSQLARLVDKEYNSYIRQKIREEDFDIATRLFNNESIKAAFENGRILTDSNKENDYYPIIVPMITAAATFSGNITYEYDLEAETTTALIPGSSSDDEDPVTDIILTSGCASRGNLCGIRTGDVHTKVPTPTEIQDSWGFRYLDDYADRYESYVPEEVLDDIDFSKRLDPSTEDGKRTIKFMTELGLLKPYTGGMLSAIEDVSVSDQTILAKIIALDDADEKLDELMLASIIVNRVKSPEYPNSILEVVRADPALFNFDENEFLTISPSTRDIASAEEALSGQFAIPSNIYSYGSSISNTSFLLSASGEHRYYNWANEESLASTDVFGRPAKTTSQILSLAQSLDSDSGDTEYVSSVIERDSDAVGVDTLDLESDYPLYVVQDFDVLTALKSLQKIAKHDFGWFGNFLTSVFSTIFDNIKAMFDLLLSPFNNKDVLDSQRLLFNDPVDAEDARDTVYQAVTFPTSTDYDTAYDSLQDTLASEGLSFLFVGKMTGINLGTAFFGSVAIPGVATTIEGFTSPTTSYYRASSPFSLSHPYVELAMPSGTTVQSVYSGTVTDVTGDTVTLTYVSDGKTYVVKYGNLTDIVVSSGQSVSKGQMIGKAGAGGITLSLTIDGTAVDPMSYFYQSSWNTGVPFADLLNPDGSVDYAKIEKLRADLAAANNRNTGAYDKWHQKPLNTGLTWECAWWAWGRGAQYLESNGYPVGSLKKTFGNGGDYYKNSAGWFKRGSVPRANSWICWESTAGAMYGHVAYVEAVEPDGSIWISESGSSMSTPSVRHITNYQTYKSSRYGTYRLAGFIYLDSPIS